MSRFLSKLTIALICVQLTVSESVLAQPESTGLPVHLAKGNVLYHFFQDDPESAIISALYAERSALKVGTKKWTGHSFTLMRAGLAIDMGDEIQAKNILGQLPPEELTLLDKSRWHFQLARQAYRNRDWTQLEQELLLISSQSGLQESSRFLFLRAELASVQGDFSRAAGYVDQIDSDNVLGRYAGFNLGLSAYRQGQKPQAESQLLRLINRKVYSHEDLMLADRARLVLANLQIEQGRHREALVLLEAVTATDEYGPQAIANLVNLALAQKKYGPAANYSRHLVESTPWHLAARDAHVGLPYALEKIYGSERASGEYYEATQRLLERKTTLTNLRAQLESSPVNGLVEIALNPEAPETVDSGDRLANDPQATFLIEKIGHSDWIGWMTSAKSQRLAAGWQSLNLQVKSLKVRREDLARLLEVDAEQKRRNRIAADLLVAAGHLNKLAQQRTGAETLISELDRVLEIPIGNVTTRAEMFQLATEAELEELRYLGELGTRARELGAGDDVRQRIARLEGLFLYNIQNELPARVQQYRARAVEFLSTLKDMEARSQRIQLASDNTEIHGRYSDRIAALEHRTNSLIARSEDSLLSTGNALIAEVTRGVSEELAGLDQQLVYLKLAMARIGDKRILAAGGQP